MPFKPGVDPSDDADFEFRGQGTANYEQYYHPKSRQWVKHIRHGSAHAEEATQKLFDALGLPNLGARAVTHLGRTYVVSRYVPDLHLHTFEHGIDYGPDAYGLVHKRPDHIGKEQALPTAVGDWLAAVHDRHQGQFAVLPGHVLHSIDHGWAWHPNMDLHAGAHGVDPEPGWDGFSRPARHSTQVFKLPGAMDDGVGVKGHLLPRFPGVDLHTLLPALALHATQTNDKRVQHDAVEGAKARAKAYEKAKTWLDLPG